MRYFTVEDYEYHLTEKNYKGLLRRLDPNRIVRGGCSGRLFIYEKCICPGGSVNYGCPVCELSKRDFKDYGGVTPNCICLLRAVTSIERGDLFLFLDRITWSEDTDKKVRSELTKLREKMLAIPRR